ncbi:hypothetical protein EAF04_008043 [Stromatinia cepivora]|nr:hypothetical protein EAF04_008043 [Stromatinia cepivora]
MDTPSTEATSEKCIVNRFKRLRCNHYDEELNCRCGKHRYGDALEYCRDPIYRITGVRQGYCRDCIQNQQAGRSNQGNVSPGEWVIQPISANSGTQMPLQTIHRSQYSTNQSLAQASVTAVSLPSPPTPTPPAMLPNQANPDTGQTRTRTHKGFWTRICRCFCF